MAVFDLTWENDTYVTITGDTITKHGAASWINSGCSSVESFDDDGSITFEATEENTHRMIGLSNQDYGLNYTTIQYAIYLTDVGNLAVYENGASRGVVGTYETGDILSVERSGETILYKNNGTLLYTSTLASNGPLRVDTSFYTDHSTIKNVQINAESLVQGFVLAAPGGFSYGGPHLRNLFTMSDGYLAYFYIKAYNVTSPEYYPRYCVSADGGATWTGDGSVSYSYLTANPNYNIRMLDGMLEGDTIHFAVITGRIVSGGSTPENLRATTATYQGSGVFTFTADVYVDGIGGPSQSGSLYKRSDGRYFMPATASSYTRAYVSYTDDWSTFVNVEDPLDGPSWSGFSSWMRNSLVYQNGSTLDAIVNVNNGATATYIQYKLVRFRQGLPGHSTNNFGTYADRIEILAEMPVVMYSEGRMSVCMYEDPDNGVAYYLHNSWDGVRSYDLANGGFAYVTRSLANECLDTDLQICTVYKSAGSSTKTVVCLFIQADNATKMARVAYCEKGAGNTWGDPIGLTNYLPFTAGTAQYVSGMKESVGSLYYMWAPYRSGSTASSGSLFLGLEIYPPYNFDTTLTQETAVPKVSEANVSFELDSTLEEASFIVDESTDFIVEANIEEDFIIHADCKLFPPELSLTLTRVPISLEKLDPVTIGGCPQCGTYLYQKRGEKLFSTQTSGGLNDEDSKFEDNKYIKCGRCGFMCNTGRDSILDEGSRAGWGLKYRTVKR